MWAAAGRVTQANYNSSNELVLGTLSLCDFRVKILTDIAPSPPLSTPLPLPHSVFTVCWNFLVYFGFLFFSSFRSVSPRIVCLPVYLLAYLLILHHSQSHVSAAAERERDGREKERGSMNCCWSVHIVWNSLLPLHLAYCARDTQQIHSTWPT